MQSLGLHHSGVTVADLDRAVSFYRQVLGLDLVDRFSVSGRAFATAVGVDGATGEFAHLDAGGSRLELVEYRPSGEPSRPDAVNQPGATHLAFAAENVDELYAGLPDDVETVSAPQTTDSGATILFLQDPEGNLIEVIEE